LPSLLTYWQAKFDDVPTKPEEAPLSPALLDPSHVAIASISGDNRSTTLRMAHTLADALLATTIVVVWQRMYGAQETGWLAAPLRMMGFVPAVVHMAWAQVLLAQPQHARTNPLWVGLAGFASVALIGAGCAVALEFGWLGEQWQGVWPYLLPLVLWQGSACLVATYSHRPFQTNKSTIYSIICIIQTSIQFIILFLPLRIDVITIEMHFIIFSITNLISFIIIAKIIKDR